jgi:hypothetical protein
MKYIRLRGDLRREDLATGDELNGGVDIKEAGRVHQWPGVSLDLGVVRLTIQKSIHLANKAVPQWLASAVASQPARDRSPVGVFSDVAPEFILEGSPDSCIKFIQRLGLV